LIQIKAPNGRSEHRFFEALLRPPKLARSALSPGAGDKFTRYFWGIHGADPMVASNENFRLAWASAPDARRKDICEATVRSRRSVKMQKADSVIAVFSEHNAAEAAIKKLAAAGFEMKNLSVVGKGYHSDEKVVGFYNTGDRIKFWGSRGAFWGGFWGLFFGGVFMTIPVVGHVIVLGYLAAMAVSAVESAVLVGGLSALGAALYSVGVPKDSVIAYEAAVKADGFLVMARLPRGNDARQGDSRYRERCAHRCACRCERGGAGRSARSRKRLIDARPLGACAPGAGSAP
jgi:hypothetical protein